MYMDHPKLSDTFYARSWRVGVPSITPLASCGLQKQGVIIVKPGPGEGKHLGRSQPLVLDSCLAVAASLDTPSRRTVVRSSTKLLQKKNCEVSDSLNSVDWREVYFAVRPRLEKIAQKRFGVGTSDAEIAFTFAEDRICSNNFEKLNNGFAGRCLPEHFVVVCFNRLLTDWWRSEYHPGKMPSWVRDLGSLAMKVWKLLCHKRESTETIVGCLGQGDPEREELVRTYVKLINADDPHCGELLGVDAPYEDNDVIPGSGDEYEESDRQVLNKAVYVLIVGRVGEQIDERLAAAVDELRDALAAYKYYDEAIQLVYLVDFEGMSITDAAKRQGMERKTASRRRAKLIELIEAFRTRWEPPKRPRNRGDG